MKSDDKDSFDKGATLTMATVSAAKDRLNWVRTNLHPNRNAVAWRIVLDFDNEGGLVKYWESSFDGAGEELIGGGFGRQSERVRLSDVQVDVLLLGVQHKLNRSSMGWSYDDRVNWSDPVRIYSPATIKALWRHGLLVGNFDDPRGVGNLGDLVGLQNLDGAVHEHCVQSPKTPKFQVWTSDLGKAVLKENGLLPGDPQMLH
jgi:hypothetical protein